MHFPLASTHNELVWGGKGLERAQTSSRPALGSLNSATHLPRHARPQSSPPSRGGRSSAPGRAGRAAGASAVPTAASLTCFQPRCRGNVVAIGIMAGVPPVGTTLGKHHRSTACRGGGGGAPSKSLGSLVFRARPRRGQCLFHQEDGHIVDAWAAGSVGICSSPCNQLF